MDTIGNMFAKIKNAQAVGKETVIIPHSKLNMAILEILLKKNFIKSINAKNRKSYKVIEIGLFYDKNGVGAIKEIARVSKPSKRVYSPAKKINAISRGRFTVISTPQGLLSGIDAIKKGVGGEVICKIR